MKNWILFALICLLFSFQNSPKKSVLTIEVRGIKKSVGKVVMAVWRKKDTFLSTTERYKYCFIDAKSGSTIGKLELPNDTYGVAVYHDINNNSTLDKNMVGVPIEIYGFGNNARNTFSAPSFEDASIELKQDKQIVIYVK
jgi:uncharacterized protein (DUF2141 family)